MRIGPWSITRQKRDALGRPLFPWEIVTLNQLSDEARQVITKMARVSAQDFYEEMREQWLEYLRSDLDTRIESSVRKARARYWEDEHRAPYLDGRAPLSAAVRDAMEKLPKHTVVLAPTLQGKAAMAAEAVPEGVCFVCERPFKAGETWQYLHTDPSQWMHYDEPGCIVTPIKEKDTP